MGVEENSGTLTTLPVGAIRAAAAEPLIAASAVRRIFGYFANQHREGFR